jgi:hypothetical protein
LPCGTGTGTALFEKVGNGTGTVINYGIEIIWYHISKKKFFNCVHYHIFLCKELRI